MEQSNPRKREPSGRREQPSPSDAMRASREALLCVQLLGVVDFDDERENKWSKNKNEIKRICFH